MSTSEEILKELQQLRSERDHYKVLLHTTQSKGFRPPETKLYSEGQDLEEWLDSLEDNFSHFRILDPEKKDKAVQRLAKGPRNYIKVMEKLQPESVKDWPSLRNCLIKRFKPINEERVARSKIYDAKQTSTVEAFILYFNSIELRAVGMDEQTKLELFVRGLKQEVKEKVMLLRPSTLNEAQQQAIDYSTIKKEANHVNGMRSNGRNGFLNPSGSQANAVEAGCKICGMSNHAAESCFKRCRKPSCERLYNHKAEECTKGPTTIAVTKDAEKLFASEEYRRPKQQTKQKKATQANHISSTAETGEEVMMSDGAILGKSVSILLDTGASTCFMSQELAKSLELKLEKDTSDITVANKQRVKCLGTTTQTLWFHGNSKPFCSVITFKVMRTNHQVILGTDFFKKYGARISFNSSPAQVILKSTKDPKKEFTIVARPAFKVAKPQLCLVHTSQDEVPDKELGPDIKYDQGNALKLTLEEYKDVFTAINKLPPRREVQHRIRLRDGRIIPPNKPAYRMTPQELVELKKQLAELQEKGFIQPSTSEFASPCLFVKKSDGSLRLVIDYRELNKLLVKDNSSIPLIEDLFIQLQKARFFSKIDLQSGYYQIPLHPEDYEKSTFKTRFGSYSFRVLPMGITGAVETFQRLMEHVFRDLLNTSVVVYLDDIVVYSADFKQHIQHVRQVLQLLRAHQLKAKMSKCVFSTQTIDFLGNTIGNGIIRPDVKKIHAIKEMKAPETRRQIQVFLGLVGYYQRYIPDFSKTAAPLTELLKMDKTFVWDRNCEKAFQSLKTVLTEDTILKLPDYEQPFYMFVDASDTALGCVLMQKMGRKFFPVYYASKKWSPAETKKAAYEKEFLSLIFGLKYWRTYLLPNPFVVYTDCAALVNIHKQKVISAKLARQLDLIANYNFEVLHLPGKVNCVADALSRLPTMDTGAARISSEDLANPSNHLEDVIATEEINVVTSIAPLKEEVSVIAVASKQKTLLTNDEEKAKVLRTYHDVPSRGHPGVSSTLKSIQNHYTWPNMRQDVEEYIRTCWNCMVNKSTTQKSYGLLKTIQSPPHRWHTISMDFIMPLTTSAGYDAILTVVDKFTKYCVLIPTTINVNAVGVAQLLLNHVISHFAIPSVIISDRDVRFNNEMFITLSKKLEMKLNFTSAYHPQSDGATEVVNKQISTTLRHYVNKFTNDWSSYLGLVQLSINARVHSSTSLSPYYLNFGRHPTMHQLTEASSRTENESTNRILRNIRQAVQVAAKNIVKAQDLQKKYADRKRTDIEFAVGEEVLLSTKNLSLKDKRIAKKLTSKFIGPFTITKANPPSYELDLSRSGLRIYPRFHASLLKKYYKRTRFINRDEEEPGDRSYQYQPEKQEYEVEKILDHKNGRYLIKWKNYPLHESTWVKEKDVHADRLIAEYEERKQLTQS